jgi:Holliday junction resolvase RusA-like endonuclease
MTSNGDGSPAVTVISAQPVPTAQSVHKYQWTVPGQPAPWVVQRWKSPRHLSASGVIRMRDYQDLIQGCFIQKFGPPPRHKGLVILDFVFYRTPGGTRKHWTDAHVLDALQRRPDTTNIQKACEDALSDFLFEDDKQVIDIRSRRGLAIMGASPRTVITAHIGDLDIMRSVAWSLEGVDGMAYD